MNQLETLKLFNEKAETLKGYERFMESIHERKVEFKQTPETAGLGTITVQGPDNESIAACVLTIRLFIQNNDPISFGNMKKIYDNLDTSQENKNEFNQIRDELNRYLDSGSPLVMSNEKANPEMILANDLNERLAELSNASLTSENRLTYREILDLFIYGDLSHTNETKREKLKQLLSSSVGAAFAWYIFTGILIQIMRCIFAVAAINQDVINEEETGNSKPANMDEECELHYVGGVLVVKASLIKNQELINWDTIIPDMREERIGKFI
jgi:hypothetical protein